MQNRKTRTATYGPWLVGLGAALWGTESAWRIPLNELFDAKVIVFWEHVFILIMCQRLTHDVSERSRKPGQIGTFDLFVSGVTVFAF